MILWTKVLTDKLRKDPWGSFFNMDIQGPAVKRPETTLPEQKAPPEVIDTSGSAQPETKADKNPPLEVFEKEEGYPYVAKYFDIRVDYNFDDLPDAEGLDLIDKFVKENIETNSKTENIKSYTNTLDSLKKKLGIDRDVKKETVIERLTGFVKAFNELKKLNDKDASTSIFETLVKLGRGKDFDAKDTELLLVEAFLKERKSWQGV